MYLCHRAIYLSPCQDRIESSYTCDSMKPTKITCPHIAKVQDFLSAVDLKQTLLPLGFQDVLSHSFPLGFT